MTKARSCWSFRLPKRFSTSPTNPSQSTDSLLSFRGAQSANPESRDSGSGPSDHPGMTKQIHWQIDSYRSSHCGFVASINLVFQVRFHFFNSFSREIAEIGSSYISNHTSRVILYLDANPGTDFVRC